MKTYQKLCTEFYDISKPQACDKEIAFFDNKLKESSGPILEAMCGSGRLLIPLLKRGHRIDGIDNSETMLASCQERCKNQNLPVNLQLESIAKMDLSKQYGVIFIAVGSFQLIHERDEAALVLKELHKHLLPGGSLILDTFIPWQSLRDSIANDSILTESQPYSGSRKVHCADGSEIRLKTTEYSYPLKQLERAVCHYEKWNNGKLIEQDEEVINVRWYYRYEMELFLEKMGFRDMRIFENSFDHNSASTVYQAFKRSAI